MLIWFQTFNITFDIQLSFNYNLTNEVYYSRIAPAEDFLWPGNVGNIEKILIIQDNTIF